MRSFISTVSVLAFAATASAQTLPNPNAMDVVRYDDGTIESVWKVQNPNGSSDYFNIDLDTDAAGKCIVGLLCNTTDFGGATQGPVSLHPDDPIDPTGHTPDLSITITATSVLPTGGALDCSDTIYDVPDITLPSGTSAHVVMAEIPGDSALWLCVDSTTPGGSGRGFFSIDGYATPAVAHLSGDYNLGTASQPCVDATLWLNGAPSTSIDEGDEICMLFRGTATVQPFMIFISAGGVPIGPAVNLVFFTGLIGSVDGAGKTASVCTTWPCGTGFTGSLGLMAFYKITGSGWFFSGEATVTVANLCPGGPGVCTDWGQRDDGVLDSTIWKVQNPAGSLDWFSTRHGPAPSGVTSVTGVEVASWDFCGTGPSWAKVGIYPSNTVVDATGGTPDVANPVLEVINGAMAPNASDWSYPATFYNTGAGAPGAAEHSAVNWAGGDTCVWIGSDMDGTDDTSNCSNIPTTVSYFTLDGYATAGTQHTIANYMMKIIWN